MYACANSDGSGAPVRRFGLGATVTAGQIVCIAANGYAGDPASVNDYTEAIGVAQEDRTYSTTQGTAPYDVLSTFLPDQRYRGKCSGGTAANTALAAEVDGNLLTNSTAETAGTVIADTNVGKSEFVTGVAVGLTGANRGAWRKITAHTDDTSETVNHPFINDIAANDTFVRTFGQGNQGLELTTNFEQFNMKLGTTVDLPDTGHAVVHDVYIDGMALVNPNHAEIINPTQPLVEVSFTLIDHYERSLA